MSKIKRIYSRQVIDSRGNPTIEVEVFTEKGSFGHAIVPSGASTGTREALELRDNGNEFMGKGVTKAINNVNTTIANEIIGMECTNQKEIDQKMINLDSTPFKSNLGANAILGVSMATAVAAAKDKKMPLYAYINTLMPKGTEMSLPVPMLNVLNGGQHADNTVDFQEYMIFPLGASNFLEAIRWSSEIFHHLAKLLHNAGYATTKGDEGGFAPNFKNNEEPLEFILKAIVAAGYVPGKDIYIAIDPASSEFYNLETKMYELKGEGKILTSDELTNYYKMLISKYPIVSIEDGKAEQDWSGFKALKDEIGAYVQTMGDDIFVTNPKILKQGIEKDIANSILIKLNQIGTLTETINAINMANIAGWTSIISHRSGETEDTFIADFAVGTGTNQIKTGSMSRSERIAKYNQLIRIAERISTFYGVNALKVKIK